MKCPTNFSILSVLVYALFGFPFCSRVYLQKCFGNESLILLFPIILVSHSIKLQVNLLVIPGNLFTTSLYEHQNLDLVSSFAFLNCFFEYWIKNRLFILLNESKIKFLNYIPEFMKILPKISTPIAGRPLHTANREGWAISIW